MIHAGHDLAKRLEQASAALGYDAVQAHRGLFAQSEAVAMPAGSGVAVFLNEESPLTQVRGAGFAEWNLDDIERFFADRMAPVTFTLTPFADASIFTNLAYRGYEFGTFENTLIRAVTADDIVPADEDIETATDAAEWSHAMAESFFGEATNMGRDLGQTLFALPTCTNLSHPRQRGASRGCATRYSRAVGHLAVRRHAQALPGPRSAGEADPRPPLARRPGRLRSGDGRYLARQPVPAELRAAGVSGGVYQGNDAEALFLARRQASSDETAPDPANNSIAITVLLIL
jgi:hypothetical protein